MRRGAARRAWREGVAFDREAAALAVPTTQESADVARIATGCASTEDTTRDEPMSKVGYRIAENGSGKKHEYEKSEKKGRDAFRFGLGEHLEKCPRHGSTTTLRRPRLDAFGEDFFLGDFDFDVALTSIDGPSTSEIGRGSGSGSTVSQVSFVASTD